MQNTDNPPGKPRVRAPHDTVAPRTASPKPFSTPQTGQTRRPERNPPPQVKKKPPVKSQSMQFDMPPPVPLSSRPTARLIHINDSSVPPPLPPRKISQPTSAHYSSPKELKTNEPPLSAPTYDRPKCHTTPPEQPVYNVPKSYAPPPSYDTLPNKEPMQPSIRTSNGSAKRNSSVSYTVDSDSMSLQQLADKYQHEFPLYVEVSAGYFGETEKDTFSEGDRLNVHFAKQTTVAVVDSGNKEVRIPLNSAIQFGLLCTPNTNNTKEAIKGFVFKDAKDIMTEKHLPLLVSAQETYKTSNAAHSVQAGEILRPIEIKHGRFGGRSLICEPLNGGKQKRLSETCRGNFSTNPKDVKLFLPEITSLFALPQRAIPFFENASFHDRQLPFATSEVVRILRVEKEKTLVATVMMDEKYAEHYDTTNGPIMFDIPVNLEVLEVQIVRPCDEDVYEKLYEDTRYLMESYDPTRSDQVRIGRPNSIFYSDIREDKKTAGIELFASECIYQDTKSLLATAGDKQEEKTDSEEYSYTGRESFDIGIKLVAPAPPSSMSSTSPSPLIPNTEVPIQDSTKSGIRKEPTPEPPQTTDTIDEYYLMNPAKLSVPSTSPTPSLDKQYSMQDVPMYAMTKLMESMNSGKLDEVDDLKQEVQKTKHTIMGVTQQMETLTQTVMAQAQIIENLQKAIQTLQQKLPVTDYVQMVPSNNLPIQGLTCEEILTILDKTNMGQYKEAFRREHVDGSLLAELDEEILSKELGIESKLHQKKILLLVQGKKLF